MTGFHEVKENDDGDIVYENVSTGAVVATVSKHAVGYVWRFDEDGLPGCFVISISDMTPAEKLSNLTGAPVWLSWF